MKKLLTSAICLLMIVTLLLFATSCTFNDPLRHYFKKANKTTNYTLTLVLTHEDSNIKITQIMHCDGNIIYYPENRNLGQKEYYAEIIDDYTIEYREVTKGKWEKDIKETEYAFDLEKNDIFNAEHYEKVKKEKNVYKQKKNIVFDSFEDLTVTIIDESVIIEGTMTMDYISYNVKIIVSDFNEHDLTLPTVEK